MSIVEALVPSACLSRSVLENKQRYNERKQGWAVRATHLLAIYYAASSVAR